MERHILHVDVNNAFLSWSAIDMIKNGCNYDIREIPSIIAGDKEKRAGIVLAKSTKAKECGVVTAEPIFMAQKKCPNLKIYPPNFNVYELYSNALYNILIQYTNKIERFSIDECFLDITEYLMGRDVLTIAREINHRVKTELGFTVNIGISSNKLLAKMASDFTKPDKIHTLYPREIEGKMWNLPVSELFMLGKKTVPRLLNMQIKTIGDLAKTDINVLIKRFGKHGKMLWEYANGIDNSEVIYLSEKPKSISRETTLPTDLYEKNQIENVLKILVEDVAYKLRREKMLAQVISVELKTRDFKQFSHQKTITEATSSTKEIFSRVKEILKNMYTKNEPIRLVGVRVDKLTDKHETQISVFQSDKKQDKLDSAIDEIKNKYGYNKITRLGNDVNSTSFDD